MEYEVSIILCFADDITILISDLEKGGQVDTVLLYIRCCNGHDNGWIEFEFIDLKSLYMKNNSERRRSVSLSIRY